MVSRSLRRERIPQNIIFLYNKDEVPNSDYIDESVLFDKYTKGIPTAATNPGSAIGTNTHNPSGGSAHTHTNTASSSHGHTGNTGASSANTSLGSNHNVVDESPSGHVHAMTIDNNTSTVSTDSTGGSHTHSSESHQPSFAVVKHVKQNITSISLRRRSVPLFTIVLFGGLLSSIPSNFSLESGMSTNNFHKGVTDAGTTPGSTGGTVSHQHDASGGHTHSLTFTNHGHNVSGIVVAGSSSNQGLATGSTVSRGDHTHTPNTTDLDNSTTSLTSSNNTHQHATQNHLPVSIEMAFISKTSVSPRLSELSKGMIIEWLGLIADIPDGLQVADGTNNTTNLIAKYPREILNDSTDPGTSDGNATHTHSAVDHPHTGTYNHLHTKSGVTSAASGATGNALTFSQNVAFPHNHSSSGSSSSDDTSVTMPGSDSHNHGSFSNDPVSIEVAFLEKL